MTRTRFGTGIRLGLVLCFALALAAGTASAQTDSRQSASLLLDQTTPNSSSGVSITIDYVNPADPAAKPHAVRRVVEELPQGALIDTSVPARCAATELELILLGAAACPAASKVGGGTVVIDTGLPEPLRFLHEDLTLLNADQQLIFLFQDQATGLRVPTRAAIEEGRRIVVNAPPLPGAPPDGAAVDTVVTTLDRITSPDGRAYVTTPPTCEGGWDSSISFTYADAVTQTVHSDSRCDGAAPSSAPSAALASQTAGPAKKTCKRKRAKKARKRKRCRRLPARK